MDSGSEVHRYLESELRDYYFRDDDSLIRATSEAAELVDVEPGIVPDDDDRTPGQIRVPDLHAQILEVLAAPEEDGQSVVSVLHDLRDEFGIDPTTDEVRSGLRSLQRKGVVEVVYTAVPTFRLAVAREEIDVEVTDRD